jgi:glutamate-1-semialdehyde aminotransferase
LKEEFPVIIIRGEDVLLVDASGDNTIDFGTAFDAGYPGHKGLLLE